MWHGYWTRRLTALRRAGVDVTARRLSSRIERVRLPDGTTHAVPVQREKGIDLRLGLDVVRLARNRDLDVAVVFSQDQDLAEVAREVRDIARSQGRWLKIVSAFPHGDRATSARGIDRTDWFRMDRAFYDACLDPRDYRPGRRQETEARNCRIFRLRAMPAKVGLLQVKVSNPAIASDETPASFPREQGRCDSGQLSAGSTDDVRSSAVPSATSEGSGGLEAISGTRSPSIHAASSSQRSATCRQHNRKMNQQA